MDMLHTRLEETQAHNSTRLMNVWLVQEYHCLTDKTNRRALVLHSKLQQILIVIRFRDVRCQVHKSGKLLGYRA